MNGWRLGRMRPRYWQGSRRSVGLSASTMTQYGVSMMSIGGSASACRAASSSISAYMPGSIQSSGSRMAIHSPRASRMPRFMADP